MTLPLKGINFNTWSPSLFPTCLSCKKDARRTWAGQCWRPQASDFPHWPDLPHCSGPTGVKPNIAWQRQSDTSFQKQIPSGLFPCCPILCLFPINLLRPACLFTGQFRVCALMAESLCGSVMGNCPVCQNGEQGQEQNLGGESHVLLPESWWEPWEGVADTVGWRKEAESSWELCLEGKKLRLGRAVVVP